MKVMVVEDMVAICMECRMIRHKNGIWGLPVRFLQTFWEKNLIPCICPDCKRKMGRGSWSI